MEMTDTHYQRRASLRQQDRKATEALQVERFNALLQTTRRENAFYRERHASCPLNIARIADLEQFPYTYKDDLVGDGGNRYCTNLTWSLERYTRLHRTSGTRGNPLAIPDTAEDWAWWLECWQYVLDSADITAADRVVMAFSFGPFVGFWSAHDAATDRGAMVVPAGGMSSLGRLDLIRTVDATAVFCTPSYALHLAEVAADNQIDVGRSSVTRIVVAGEPGGSMPAVRERIESAWQATVFDHAGATEVGAWGFADPHGRGLYINEAEFIPEFLSTETGAPAEEGELSELVLTSLRRFGAPVIRYRTGDLVRPSWTHANSCQWVFLPGGVLGRIDDMLVVRGVNIFPSSVEQILRSFPEVIEFRMTAHRRGEMDALGIEVEDRLNDPKRIERELEVRLGLKVAVRCVAMGTLPRFEMKGSRFVDRRNEPS